MGNTRLKLAKSQAKANQQPAAELSLIESCSISFFMLSSKLILDIQKVCIK